MAFLIFEQTALEGHSILRPTGGTFKLAGYNLLYRAWENRGKPLNVGWQVARDELLRLHFYRKLPEMTCAWSSISTQRLREESA
jgi:hypothetical protein